MMETGYERQNTVSRFLDLLEAHRARFEDTIQRVNAAYAYKTPARPVFQFDVTGFWYQRSAWVQSSLDELLDHNLQRIRYQLESMPESDYVPTLSVGIGTSDLIPRMFGATFDVAPGGGVIQRFNLIERLPEDLKKFKDIDVTLTEPWQDVVERVRFLAEMTRQQVYIAHPQMQGPDTNIPRLMDQSEFLMACRSDPESMKELSDLWGEVASRLQAELIQVAMKPGLMRPRARFFQPEWVSGVVVGDYLPFMNPERWFEIFGNAFQLLTERVGPVFYHTCGPVTGTEQVLMKLPGLVGFETSFVKKQSKRLPDLVDLKKSIQGRLVLCSFAWHLGGFTEDMENFTAEWLWNMNQGGGFMIQDTGSVEQGYDLFHKLNLL